MALLNFTEIMAAEDITERDIEVPQWGGSVSIRSISHRLMREIKKDIAKKSGEDEPDEDEIEKWVLIKGMVSPTITEEEYEHLMDKSTQSIMVVLSAILGRSNATDTAAKEEEKTFRPESE